jgi:hypothetical protein
VKATIVYPSENSGHAVRATLSPRHAKRADDGDMITVELTKPADVPHCSATLLLDTFGNT